MVNLLDYDVVVFDLDDTLYSEKDYVLSGYCYLVGMLKSLYSVDTHESFFEAILNNENDVFDYVLKKHQLPAFLKEHLILAYRYHKPNLILHDGAFEILNTLVNENIPVYLITDGRGITQRLKIEALKIGGFLDGIYISEEVGAGKPSPDSFIAIANKNPNKKIVYIADNPKKDFVAPNALGWDSIGLLHKKSRIHPLPENYETKANVWLEQFKELIC